jgi:hypothetical protein
MPQLVGQPCVRCGQSIVSLLSAELCAGCGKAVHLACRVPDAELDTPWHCSRCGGDPSRETPDGLQASPLEPPPDEPFRTITVPDIRLRRRPRQKALIVLGVLVLGGVIVGLCWAGYGWLQRSEIERLVRKDFEQRMRQDVSAIHLKRTDANDYSGTITTAAGEDWHVKVSVTHVGRSRQFRWEFLPPLERSERELRKDLETRLNRRLRSLKVARGPDGRLSGTAELTSGEQFDIREEAGPSRRIVYEWNQATVEKALRQSAREQHNDELASLSLTRQGPGDYAGKAVGKSGLEYRVRDSLKLELLPSSYGRWVTQRLAQEHKLKVKSISLKPHPAGYWTGQATLETGLIYEVRAGTPPAWRKGPRDREPTWSAVLSPDSYPQWIKNGLEQEFPYKVKSVTLRPPAPDGSQVGTAHLEDGADFRVWVKRKKVEKKEGEHPPLWPDLPAEMQWGVGLPKDRKKDKGHEH